MILAHVAGMPVEELLVSVVSTGSALAVGARLALSRLRDRSRRR